MKRLLLVISNCYFNNFLLARLTGLNFHAFPFYLPARKNSLFIIAIFCATNLFGQGQKKVKTSEYEKIIKERCSKIVDGLGITDSNKYNAVLNELTSQYFQLNVIHEQNKEAIAGI